MAEMWLRRVIAVSALAIAVLAIAVVALRPVSSAPADSPTPTRTPTVKAKAPKQSAALPVVGEVTGSRARRMAVPILMYHVITAAPPRVANAELWVDEEVFADEMRALQAAGYTAVTLRQAWDGWQHGGPLPRKPVVVTFDDGYLSHYTHAKPVLRELGWPGVLFLTTKAIGPGGLTEHQLRSLLKAGWEIDSHTLTHPDLTTLDDTALTHELSESRRELQQRLGVPADFFAYPAGRYDARVVAATAAAGYMAATTVEPGIATRRDDPFALPRVRVNASDTAETLLARLR
jgi:peptidoglycan/xylan/chitin deacetylase (PgdA/CDA1 family)